MGKKYLIALDGSEHSKYSLLWALENLIDPKHDSVSLLSVGVLSVSTPCEYTAATRIILNDDNEKKLERQRAEERAEKIIIDGKNLIGSFFEKPGYSKVSLSVECFVDSNSDPAKYIVDFLKEQDIDILVMGHRGISSPDASDVGSVSKHCMHSSVCTVVITKRK